MNKRRFCIAPMMKCTDRHYRTLMRLMSKHCWLYTEMVTAQALLHGDQQRLLAYGAHELPLALQVGGSDIDALRHAAQLAASYGFSEVNLNVGCPSDRVQSGAFGVCLMKQPELVARAVAEMQSEVDIPVTVKTRVGVDEDYHSYDYFLHFIDTVAASGCEVFIIHARKAWLNGLSPKQNRNVPPLQYEWVRQLKLDRPHLEIIINGGIGDISDCKAHLADVDGVMVGRTAYSHPYRYAQVDSQLFAGVDSYCSPYEVLKAYLPYVERQLRDGERLSHLIRPILPLFHGLKHAKTWRRFLSEHAWRKEANFSVLLQACALLSYPDFS